MYSFAYFQQTCDPSPPLRCYHGSELSYLFGHPRQTPCHRPRFTPSEQELSDSLRESWANLIHSGREPNADIDDSDSSIAGATARLRMLRSSQPHGSKEVLERVFWPAFREGQDERMLRFDARNITLVPLDQHEAEACDFWDTTMVYSWGERPDRSMMCK